MEAPLDGDADDGGMETLAYDADVVVYAAELHPPVATLCSRR